MVSCKVKTDVAEPIQSTVVKQVKNDKPKNVILLIGDGMGLGQITAGMYSQGNKTALENFRTIGLHKCYAANDLITDSAAAATAFASGVKTFNGAIGVDVDSLPVKTILEEAEVKGFATGLVATSTIVHATPASFIAHNVSRRNYEDIAEDFLKTDIDFFIGGGKKFFDRREKDDRDLLVELREKGYQIYDYLTELDECEIDSTKNFAYITSDSDPLKFDQGRDYLLPATSMALDYLDKKNETGFFLMVEGSQIDWGGHANLSDYIVSEFQEFDKTIDKVFKWAQLDGETLVIVTADHETGGYAIQQGSTMDSLVTAFTSTYHTGTMIPVFAYGPGSESFNGIYENTEIYHKMKRALGWLSK